MKTMHTNRSIHHFAGRAAAFTFLLAGMASAAYSQQAAPAFSGTSSLRSGASSSFLLASAEAPASPASSVDAASFVASDSSSSSSSDALASDPAAFRFASDASQPPPRRRYGRPNYSDSHTNPDGSSKFAFMAGAGLTSPVMDTGKYLTPNYVFQVGAGRNWSKKFGVMLQFDYDHFGFQGSTLANQQNLYNTGIPSSSPYYVSSLDGNSHVWSFTLDPTFTFMSGEQWGAYAVAGVGFYHKTANFFVPTTEEACSYYGCFDYAADETIDKYSSNAPGFDGGMGITYKPSRFSGERFYLEARYVFVDNSTRAASATNYYPPNANQTYYIPATLGLRF
jgi:hypothetical protein